MSAPTVESFHDAAAAGDTVALRAALKAGIRVDARGERGRTALMGAAQHGRADAIRLLVRRGAKLHKRDDDKFTALHHAALGAQPSAIAALLKAGANPDLRRRQGITPLLDSAWRGPPEAVRLLLDSGANIDARDDSGKTALIAAAHARQTEVVRLLVKRGAHLNRQGSQGRTALMTALSVSAYGIAHMLVQAGANVDIPRDDGTTALFTAMRDERLTLTILDLGANVNRRTDTGHTPLFSAANVGSPRVLQELLDRGANVGAINKRGETPLMVAAWNGREAIARALVQAGVDVNIVDRKGKTALSRAIHSRELRIVELLLEAGADTSDTALLCAGVSDIPSRISAAEYLARLEEHGAAIDDPERCLAHPHSRTVQRRIRSAEADLAEAVEKGERERLERILRYEDVVGWEALVRALETDDAGGLMRAVLRKQKSQAGDADRRSRRAAMLREAVSDGRAEFVAVMIDEYPDLLVEPDYAYLQQAVSTGEVEIVDRLLTGGSSPNGGLSYKEPPLHTSVRSGRRDITDRLLRAGADVDIQYGCTTAYGIAERGNDPAAMEQLKAAGADTGLESDCEFEALLAAIDVRPRLFVQYSTLESLSAVLGIVIGDHSCHGSWWRTCNVTGLLVEAAPGLSGIRASVGYAIADDLFGLGIKGSYARTWGTTLPAPFGVGAGQNLIGASIDGRAVALRLSAGVMVGLTEPSAGKVRLTLGVGLGAF